MNVPTWRRPSSGDREHETGGVAQFRTAIAGLERVQDVVTLLVGAALLLMSLGILVSAVIDFFHGHGTVIARATGFLDEVLLVLILVEVVHTVMLSLRSHALQAEPFVVVALIAAIRKLLFVLGNQQHLSTAQFALFLATAATFVAALVVLRRYGRADPEEDSH